MAMSVASEISIGTGRKIGTWGNNVLTNGDMEAWTATYCAQYQTVYDSFTTKPSAAEATIWNTFVASIVGTGEWAMLDILDIFSTHINSDSEALKNWKTPGTFDPTLVNNPAFAINEGFTGNGSNAYIDTNWTPSTDGVNYVRDSASQIIYIRTDVNTSRGHGTFNNADGKDCVLYPRTANVVYVRINNGLSDSGANTDGSGMYINTRTAAAVNKLYRNKSAIINGTTISAGIPTHNPYCFAYNDDGVATGFRADQVSMYAFGSGFTQTNVNNLTDAYNTAMTALGKNVF